MKNLIDKLWWLIPIGVIYGIICLLDMPNATRVLGTGFAYFFLTTDLIMVTYFIFKEIHDAILSAKVSSSDMLETAFGAAFFGLLIFGPFCFVVWIFHVERFSFLRWTDIDAVTFFIL